MKTKAMRTEQIWLRPNKNTVHFSDFVIIIAFSLSLLSLLLTFYCISSPYTTEANPIMRTLIGVDTHIALLYFSAAWAFIFSMYYYSFRKSKHASIMCLTIFAIFMFNFLNDLNGVLILKGAGVL